MSDNHHIDFVVVKKMNESPYKLEISETSLFLNVNLGKIESISFSDEILTFRFNKGHLRIDMAFEDMSRYFSIKKWRNK
ncbi:MAG: hypothetical protein ACXAC5_19490 [Promethearchaeota archaeon]|jgi:hypothetical protein